MLLVSSSSGRAPRGARFAARCFAALCWAALSGGALSWAALCGDPALAAEPATQDASATAPDTLLGDWWGAKSHLARYGIDVSFDYTTESAANVAGGIRRGGTYTHQFGLGIDLDWQRIAGWSGLATHAIFINRAGRNASEHYIGDPLIQAQEIYGAGYGQPLKLVWLYGEQKLYDDAVNIAFGRFAPGTNFNTSPLFCNFMTLTICGHNHAINSQQGFETFPMNVWGGRVRVRPTGDTYIMAGAFQSQPFPTDDKPWTQGGHTGWTWFDSRDTTGVSIPVEFAYEPSVGPGRLPGHYKIGFNWDTSHYRDNLYDEAGNFRALSGLAGLQHAGRGQLWVQADQMVWRRGPGATDGLILIGSYGHDQSDTTVFEHFYWAGLVDRGFWAARPRDQINLGVAYYTVSPKLRQTQEIQRALGLALENGARGVQRDALVLEASYAIDVLPGLVIQPVLEYFIRPGAVKETPDAFVLGLKTVAKF